MKRKISLLALLLTLILVSSCAKNNPLSANNTTNNDDSSILPDDDAGSVPPGSTGLFGGVKGYGFTMKTISELYGIYSSEHIYLNNSKHPMPIPMNIKIYEESFLHIGIKIDLGSYDDIPTPFTSFTGTINGDEHYLESDIIRYHNRNAYLQIVFDRKDYSIKRVTLIDKFTEKDIIRKTAIKPTKGIRREK
uniref:hypothetical protein n=1 Tax=Brachyspira catarrhinii TaxID=2528966 RepID=UPI003F4BE098